MVAIKPLRWLSLGLWSLAEARPWEAGSDCETREERCMGTELWCAENYLNERYGSAEACKADRARDAKPEWKLPRIHCFRGPGPDQESCLGTDEFCRTKPRSERTKCFESRQKAPWWEPKSKGCIPDIDIFDERCLGTQAWCRQETTTALYGSESNCRQYRSPRLDPPPKLPFVPERAVCHSGNAGQEDCLGTERFCGRTQSQANDVDGQACVTSRSKPWFSAIYSSSCTTNGGKPDQEACVGTDSWCSQQDQIDLYTSESKCLEFRRGGEPTRLPWQYGSKPSGCSGSEEQCLGTDRACSTFESVELRRACVLARERPPSEIPQGQDCSGDSEECIGTEAWCQKEDVLKVYRTKENCENIRRKGDAWLLEWHYSSSCSGLDEACLGTEKFCAMHQHPASRRSCFEMREKPNFMTPNSGECPEHLLFKEAGSSDERCLGTEEWCDKMQDTYGSKGECLQSRRMSSPGSLDWHQPQPEGSLFQSQSEEHLGTEQFCRRIDDQGERMQCLAARKARVFSWRSQDCLGLAQLNTEPCFGTEAWCKTETSLDIYKSKQECLKLRSNRTDTHVPGEKLPWLPSTRDKCGDCDADQPLGCLNKDVKAEECMGTEKFCTSNGNPRDTIDCLETRQRSPWAAPETSQCVYAHSEPCMGTEKFCKEALTRPKFYENERHCRAFREPPSPAKWQRKGTSCRHNDSEECLGTEEWCNGISPRDECFAGRELAPFVVKPEGCKEEAEHCVGTDVWCHERYSQAKYGSEAECFSRRGFKQDAVVQAISSVISASVKDAVLRYGQNVTRHAVYYNLVREGGDEGTAKRTIQTYLDGYLDLVEKEGLPEGTKRFMTAVQQKANEKGSS